MSHDDNTNNGPINPASNHPFQVVNTESPKGAWEEKQIDTDYHVRIDMPGVPESGLTITRNPDKNEIRFCGKVPSFEDWPECARAYASVIHLNTSVDDIEFEHSLVNGCLRFIFHKAKGELQMLKYRGGKAVDKSYDDHLIYGDLESTSCHRGVSTLGEISLTQEKCEINPLMIGSPRSCIVRKWLSDGGQGNVLHILLDTPGMEDFKFDIGTKACVIRGALEEDTNGDFLKSGRSYFFSIKFNCGCCMFDKKGTKKRDQILKDGLLRLKVRVSRSCNVMFGKTSRN